MKNIIIKITSQEDKEVLAHLTNAPIPEFTTHVFFGTDGTFDYMKQADFDATYDPEFFIMVKTKIFEFYIQK